MNYAQAAMLNQIAAMRHPRMDLGSLRSTYDLDGRAFDAVEGRGSELEFYRQRKGAPALYLQSNTRMR